jgi:hypothetical protein
MPLTRPWFLLARSCLDMSTFCFAFTSAGWRKDRKIDPRYGLVGGFNPSPLKNHGVKVSWDDDIPN